MNGPAPTDCTNDRRWSIGSVQIDGPLVLAPMAGHTSLPLRLLCKRAGADLVCSEMVAAQGLAHRNRKTRGLLKTCPQEKPVAIQIFGGEPTVMADAAPWLEDAGADIVDINMGCPVPKVKRAAAGAALMSDPDRAVAIAAAVVDRSALPVTCKLRAGRFEGDEGYIELALRLQGAGVSAIAIHGRTVAQGFSGEADHTPAARLVEALDIPVIASGDVFATTAPRAILEDTGCAGVMFARGAMGRPWVFSQARAILRGEEPPPDPPIGLRLGIALCQAQMLAEQFGERIAVHEMRGHLAWYSKGTPHAAQLRQRCNQVKTLRELAALFEGFAADRRAA